MNAHEQGVEAAARRIAPMAFVWGSTETDKAMAVRQVETALSAYLEASGLVLAPKEPTDEMVPKYMHPGVAKTLWLDMISAFPQPLQAKEGEA